MAGFQPSTNGRFWVSTEGRACLLFSLVESLGILPAHLAHVPRRNRAGLWRRLQRRIADGLLVVRSPRLRTGPGRRAPLALPGGGRVGHLDTHRRLRAGRLDQVPVRPVDRERVHDRVDHYAAGHRGRSNRRGRGEVRGGRRTAARETGGGDRPRLLPARGDVDRRSAGAGAGRRPGGTDQHRRGGRFQYRRDHRRARARGDTLAHQRAARHPVARGDRPGSGSVRGRLPHVASELRGGRRRGVFRAGSRPSAGRRRRAQGPAVRVRRRLRGRRFHSYRQGGDAAGHPARGRNARAEAAGSGAAGAAGVLRRGSAAHPARTGRCPRHGPLPPGATAIARQSGEHARAHAERWGGAVQPGGAGGARARVRRDPAHRPQQGRERDCVGRPADRIDVDSHCGSARAHPARNALGFPGRVLHVKEVPRKRRRKPWAACERGSSWP